jgi:hypothetical protein
MGGLLPVFERASRLPEGADGECMRWDGMKAQFNDHRMVPRQKKRWPMRCDVEPCLAHTNFGLEHEQRLFGIS